MKRAWARELLAFIAVAARRLHLSPWAITSIALSTESTGTSTLPSRTHRCAWNVLSTPSTSQGSAGALEPIDAPPRSRSVTSAPKIST